MTRADFYVGTGPNARYLGSVFNDGGDIPASVKRARTPEKFEKAVARLIKKENGYTTWQWGWETSQATDFSYWLENEKLYVVRFGKGEKVIEKKRGRPAAFERTWEMPVMVPNKHPLSLTLEEITGPEELPDDASVRQLSEITKVD